jgi:hypothetical protein
MDQNHTSNPPHYPSSGLPKGSSMAKPLAVVVLLIIFTGVGFWGGISYEKSHNKLPSSVNTTAYGGFSGGSGYGSRFSSGQRPIFGSVTAINPTSISIQESQTDSTETLTITSNTSITDNGQAVSASDIQAGDTVAIIQQLKYISSQSYTSKSILWWRRRQ